MTAIKRSNDLVKNITAALKPLGSKQRAVGAKAYLKSDLQFWGVPNGPLRSTTLGLLRPLKDLTREELVTAAKALWANDIHELRHAAMELLVKQAKLLSLADLPMLEQMLRDSKSWAYVDYLATHVVGPIVIANPTAAKTLDRWAKDDDFWIRRSAMLALLGPLRKGGGDWDRFAGYADAMLDEKEFFIRKAIGWILREVSKDRPKLVFDWLLPRKARVSGVTMREALKYLTAAQQKQLKG